MKIRNLVTATVLLIGLLATGSGQAPKERKAVIQDLALNQLTNAQFPPTDAQPNCLVTSDTFNQWFQGGSVSLNGVVEPANSVSFGGNGMTLRLDAAISNGGSYGDTPNCSFYQWAEQMFLWLTSPAPRSYGGGGVHIFDSMAFYDVSPPDANGNRNFIPHGRTGIISVLPLRAAQAGPHGLPIIFDKAGRMLEVERTQLSPSGKPLIANESGKLIEIEHASLTNGQAVFLDKTGRAISRAKPLLRKDLDSALMVQRFMIGTTPVFLNSSGNVVEVEQGQSDNGVLEAQNGSLVYYATAVNDVYAYFLTGMKNHAITANQFPTTQDDLNQIIQFAGHHGKTFPDPNALAIEVKTSWVEAAGLPNLSSYITRTGTIPTYTKSNLKWIPSGQKTVQLALVGMHVVGSASGHPEMIWATFEHVGNSPLGAYSYINTSRQTRTVPQSTAGTWLFSANNAAPSFNEPHMSLTAPNIVAFPNSPYGISPSNTIRWKAWGAASDVSPNPIDGSTAVSNTRIISINNSVRGMLAGSDLRGNYLLVGATWTAGGAAPNSSNQVGTSRLSNTTMETYQQGKDSTQSHSTNCLTCHTGSMLGGMSGGLSHIYGPLQPLFP